MGIISAFRYGLDGVLHFMRANSRHGTHSPFVYRLADQLIYRKNGFRTPSNGSRVDVLLQDLADFFDVSYAVTGSTGSKKEALIINAGDIALDDLARLQRVYAYIVVRDIYKRAANKRFWRVIEKDARFIVLIDLFYFGLIFYRPQQLKQTFTLRFPYWR